MTDYSGEWLDIVRREAQDVHSQDQKGSTLVTTGYDPDTHSVKGILVPHGVETDFIPISNPHAGNGFGMAIGPEIGDDKTPGDQFSIHFENGDPNSPVARHKLFSSTDKPPRVESGEMILKHKNGATILFDKDKNLTATGSKNTDQKVQLSQDGSVTLQDSNKGSIVSKDGNITATDHSGATITLTDGNITLKDKDGGIVYMSAGLVYLGSKTASNKVMTDGGPSSKVFALV